MAGAAWQASFAFRAGAGWQHEAGVLSRCRIATSRCAQHGRQVVLATGMAQEVLFGEQEVLKGSATAVPGPGSHLQFAHSLRLETALLAASNTLRSSGAYLPGKPVSSA